MKNQNQFLRNFYFITILREPLARYVSEYKHSLRLYANNYRYLFGGTMCNKPIFLRDCFQKMKIKKITLGNYFSCLNSTNINLELFFVCIYFNFSFLITYIEQFSSCEDYVAKNRQTRLLANYNPKDKSCSIFKDENKKKLLENAKEVLKKMSYFALAEYEELSQKLFEKTFKNSFKFDQKVKFQKHSSTTLTIQNMNITLKEKLIQLNDLDIKLYNFAKKLFFDRLGFYNIDFDNPDN